MSRSGRATEFLLLWKAGDEYDGIDYGAITPHEALDFIERIDTLFLDAARGRIAELEAELAELAQQNAYYKVQFEFDLKRGVMSTVDEWNELTESWQGHSIGDFVLLGNAAIAELEAALILSREQTAFANEAMYAMQKSRDEHEADYRRGWEDAMRQEHPPEAKP